MGDIPTAGSAAVGLPSLMGGTKPTSTPPYSSNSSDRKDRRCTPTGHPRNRRPPSITRDPTPLNPVSGRLDAQADRLGDTALQRLVADFPPLAHFDDHQLARTREDLVFIVHFLAAAIVAGDPEIFVEFLDWLQVLLDNRGAPPRSLIGGLDALEPAIEAVDAAAAQLIDAGRQQLLAGLAPQPITRPS
jgi:hypothetical protein